MGDNIVKIGMYADDTFLGLGGSDISLKETLEILQLFYKCSGLKINIQKTKTIWLGKSKTYNMEWVTRFGLVGITFDLYL